MRQSSVAATSTVATGIANTACDLCWRGVALAAALIALLAATATVAQESSAEPSDPPSNDQLIRPLPPIVSRPTNWTPEVPFPYDQTRNQVTPAEIRAEAEM